MSIRWSSIHERLGETPRDLDFALLQAAVDARLTETESLDWKKNLPAKGEEPAREFCKDVAAMANTRGGLIVYGIEEEAGTAAALAFSSVDNGDPEQRRLRQLAANGIHPMVTGLQCLPLENADGTKKVLVLVVPRSPDAPHMIGVRDRIGIPFRYGAATEWLREAELARAYADRFAGRESENRKLAELVDEVTAMLDLGRSAWLVGVARPRTPLPAIAGPVPASAVLTVLEAVLNRTNELASTNRTDRWSIIRDLDSNVRNPQAGLRRWIVRIRTSQNADMLSRFAHVELHHDGSAVLAAHISDWRNEEPASDYYQVVCSIVESFAADFAALAESFALHLGGEVPMTYRCELRRAKDLPYQAFDFERYPGGFFTAKFAAVHGAWKVRQPRPVTGEIALNAETEDLRDVARTIALDIVNQFGVSQLHLLT